MMSVINAIEQVTTELMGISVPVYLKNEIAEPIMSVVEKLKGLQEAVERLHKQDTEEKENLRRLNQEMAEKLMQNTAEEQGENDNGKD